MSLGGSLNDCTPPIPDTRNKSPILFILFFILFLKKNKKSRDNGLLLRKKKIPTEGKMILPMIRLSFRKRGALFRFWFYYSIFVSLWILIELFLNF